MHEVRRFGRRLLGTGLAAALLLGGLVGCGDDDLLAQAEQFLASGDIGAALASFQAALGGVNAPGTAGPLASGRREINWDGVPGGVTNTDTFPADFFNPAPGSAGSARGLLLSTPGTGLRVSDNDFGDVNPNYAGEFDPFSPAKTFAAVGSNVVDVTFEVPTLSGTPARVQGFGAVFSDVDSLGSTQMQFFNGNTVLGTFAVPVRGGNGQPLSFLGVRFSQPVVTRVRLVLGSNALGANVNDGGNVDLVVVDDFIYGEPQPL